MNKGNVTFFIVSVASIILLGKTLNYLKHWLETININATAYETIKAISPPDIALLKFKPTAKMTIDYCIVKKNIIANINSNFFEIFYSSHHLVPSFLMT